MRAICPFCREMIDTGAVVISGEEFDCPHCGKRLLVPPRDDIRLPSMSATLISLGGLLLIWVCGELADDTVFEKFVVETAVIAIIGIAFFLWRNMKRRDQDDEDDLVFWKGRNESSE